jgi:hypothetical protein
MNSFFLSLLNGRKNIKAGKQNIKRRSPEIKEEILYKAARIKGHGKISASNINLPDPRFSFSLYETLAE